MLIEIRGYWLNPDKIIRLANNSNGNVEIVMEGRETITIRTTDTVDDIGGLIVRSCANGKR